MHLLITGAWQNYAEYAEKIKQLGHNVAFMQFEKDELPCDPKWVEGIIGNGFFLHHNIEEFPNLSYIQLTSAGLDRVPMDYVQSHCIKIYNARGVYSVPMAELAISGVLQLLKQTKFFNKTQQNHEWEKRRDLRELCGQTVCVVGCGSVGTECAKRFKAFGCEVIGVDLFDVTDKTYDETYNISDLSKALPETDVLVLTLPLTEQTKGVINAERFAELKDNSIVVNIARGAVVETSALINSLKTKLFGAVLDVFETEPLDENSELWDMENVILTPHNSFVSDGNAKRLADVILGNLKEN